MRIKPRTMFAALCLSASFALSAAADENAAKFASLLYPIEVKLQAGAKEGDVFFRTPLSEVPAAAYDSVLIQGEMPDAGIRVDLETGDASAPAAASYRSEAFHRLPSGRFWARYRVPLSRRPLRFAVINAGLKTGSALTIYETELFVAAESKEGPPQGTGVPYVPDPALFLPADAPFKVIRRADWKAAPPTEAYTPHEPKFFTLHHTQSHYPETYEKAVEEMQFIQDFHQNGRGWIDIAYHFLIDPAGNIFEGRPIKALGAHVKNHNTGNIGISIMGSYAPPVHNVFTKAAQDSFVAIGRYLKDTYEVPVSSFYAHRDLGPTDCPGDDLYAKKGLLRDLIFTPSPLPGVPADPQSPNPAQRRSLNQLLQYLAKP